VIGLPFTAFNAPPQESGAEVCLYENSFLLAIENWFIIERSVQKSKISRLSIHSTILGLEKTTPLN
jgi:hypothetical protein